VGERHRSLRRQLRKCGIDPDKGPDSVEAWSCFLDRISATYASADRDRYTAQRALEISSREMDELSLELAADRERLTGMIEALPQVLVYTDADLSVRFSNAHAADLLGEVSAGAHIDDQLVLFDNVGDPIEIEDFALIGHRESSGYAAGVGGERFDAAWHIVPILVDSMVSGILLVVTDLREIKDAEAELHLARLDAEISQQTEAARGRFLANVSHELRTPLNAILGYSEMLQEEATGQDHADLSRILHSGRHLLALINNLLDMSKIDAGKMELDLSEFELDALLQQVSATALPLAQKQANELVVDNRVTAPLRTDLTRLRQCLLNLVSNAAKFTDSGRITVSASQHEDQVQIAVADTGQGIPASRLKSIFDAFEQVGPGDEGTGLGLALTRAFVQLMGGNIEAESTEGHGSTFTIIIPRQISASA